MNFTIINHSNITDHVASVHREGCRDIERNTRQVDGVTEAWTADDANQVVEMFLEDLNADFEAEEPGSGYCPENVKVHACAR